MVDTPEDLLDYLKLDPDHHEKIAALIPKETWYEQIIRYGLYIGAVFQMVCILVSRSSQDFDCDCDCDCLAGGDIVAGEGGGGGRGEQFL